MEQNIFLSFAVIKYNQEKHIGDIFSLLLRKNKKETPKRY